ncbi:MAG: ABC transporter permease [Acidimicrobiia bacterium]|nr:ABC transporter permease [Acidimicrobiia bacterium]
MLRTTLRSLWQHKRRLISTTVAVLLGVAFMAGTFVLGDTLDNSIDELVGEVTVGIDAEVRGPELFDSGFGALRAPVDASLVDTVAGVDGVEDAAGYVQSMSGRILDSEGEALGQTNGAPTIFEAFIPNGDLSGYEIVDGRGVEADDEMVLNRGATDDADLAVGDQVEITSALGRDSFTLVGIYTIKGRDSIAGAVTASFTPTVAQELAGLPGQFQLIYATAADGVEQPELADAINSVLPEDSGGEAITGEQSSEELSDSFSEGLAFFSTFLLIFALIALVVGSFIIFNTFSILVAQRGKELALLRAIGATRRQVLVSVLVEAILVGLIAAFVGIAAGIGLAIGLVALLDSIGLELPSSGVVIAPATVVWALIAGVGVTLFSAMIPAWRATRVPPIAALRDVATDASGTSKVRAVIGIILFALGLFMLTPAFGEAPDSAALPSVGLGAVLLLVALVVLGPVIARPAAKLFGAPLSALRGTPGHLARENAARSPKRTASTAAALMIGVALVGFITIFAESARASIDDQITRGLKADLILQSESFDVGIPLEVSTMIAERDDVAGVASVRQGLVQLTMPDGSNSTTFMGAVDPEVYPEAVEVQMAEGSLSDLRPGGIVVDARQADERDIAIGDTITLTFPTGSTAEVEVVALSEDPQLLGLYTISHEDWSTNVPNQTDGIVFVSAADGVDVEELQASIEEAIEPYVTVIVQDRDEFLGSIAAQLNTALNVIYGLLALSLIIALIGIANTLSLSIYERTRELGLLRAVGMTRAQLRSSVRWEAAIIALLGTVLGVLLALALSYTLVQALGPQGFSTYDIPVTSLVVIVAVFAILGVLASVLPARRAAKLNVLEAIATE